MTATVPGLRLRKTFGREDWLVPEPFGIDGWRMVNRDQTASVIVTVSHYAPLGDDRQWIHASIGRTDRMPEYDELVLLHQAAFAGGWAYQVFAPPEHHVNIHAHSLHLWGLLSGEPLLPNFGALGSI